MSSSDQPASGPRPTVVVVGLGPAGAELVTEEARRLASDHRAWLRTRRHPAADGPPFDDLPSFDHLYADGPSLDAVYQAVVDELAAAAQEAASGPAPGPVVYVVPGSPLVAERTVELLRADERVAVDVRPALSFLDLAWARLGVDPVAVGASVVDGQRFAVEAAGRAGPLLVAQCDSATVLSDVKLALAAAIEASTMLGAGSAGAGSAGAGSAGAGSAGAGSAGAGSAGAGSTGPGAAAGVGARAGSDAEVGAPPWGPVPDGLEVVVLQRLGLADEHVTTVRWDDLDRAVEPDHLTSLWLPRLAAPVAGEVQRFAELVATLRRGCPWDRAQTHHSLRRHLLEEAYEVLDAIDALPEGAGAAPNGPDGAPADPEGAVDDVGDGGRVAGPGHEPASGPVLVDTTGYEHLEEELGDLLFQVVFHATLAAEAGQFTLADVATTVHDKLYARHPHVFAPAGAEPDTADLVVDWERQKQAEKGRASVFDGIPTTLPALLYATKVLKKADVLSQRGMDIPRAPGLPDLGPVVDAEALGTLLLGVVEAARRAGLDPESALRVAALAHRDDVQAVEP